MDKQIKDAFNEIHAPKNLIEDTKKKVKEAKKEETVTTKTKNNHWKAVSCIATLAACAALMVIGKNFLSTENTENPQTEIADTTDFMEEKDSYNVAGNNSIKEFEFIGKKELSEWYQILENMEDTNAEQTSLDANYIIYTFDYPTEEGTYHIEIFVENGELYRNENNLILKGIFKGEVYSENIKLGETTLDISSSSQFTKQEVVFDLQDINNDGSMEFLLETTYNETGENSTEWYTVEEQFNIVPCNQQIP